MRNEFGDFFCMRPWLTSSVLAKNSIGNFHIHIYILDVSSKNGKICRASPTDTNASITDFFVHSPEQLNTTGPR